MGSPLGAHLRHAHQYGAVNDAVVDLIEADVLWLAL